jgi:hypothetical protein
MEIRGRCGCGSVTFAASGEPRFQVYCHCRSCQTAHAAPLVAAALFPVDQVVYTGELVRVTVTQSPDATPRMVCPKCGTKVINVPHPSVRTILPSLCEDRSWFKAQMHMYWQDRVIDVADSLPKYLDFPKEFGGTGKLG